MEPKRYYFKLQVDLVSGIIQFLTMPFFVINFVLLYMRLKDRAANI
jgi:hypothetical protein